ncbi:MAG: RraA family protein [Hyphomonadaceae bacterium]|nr:RraA family protein [Hyphomonadaceae bacterium]
MKEFIRSLARYDTPTISNAIEVARGGRGYDGFTRGTPVSAMNGAKAMIGYARTARISGVRSPAEPPDVIKARRLEYFKYMAMGDQPSICVIEDVDAPDCVSAWWGEVHTAVHKGLGISGALTNGVMRDLDDHEPGFPVVAGSVGPSHMFVHVTELDTPVTVFELTIEPGELVHADQHGAVLIPEDVLPELGDSIKTLLANEQIILGPAREPGFDIDKLQDAWKAFEEARI